MGNVSDRLRYLNISSPSGGAGETVGPLGWWARSQKKVVRARSSKGDLLLVLTTLSADGSKT